MHDVLHVSQLKQCIRVPTEGAPLGTLAVLKVGQNHDLTRSNAIKTIDPSTTKMLYVVKESSWKVRIFEEVERRTRHRAIDFLSSIINPSENEASWDGKIVCVRATPLSSPSEPNLGTRFL